MVRLIIISWRNTLTQVTVRRVGETVEVGLYHHFRKPLYNADEMSASTPKHRQIRSTVEHAADLIKQSRINKEGQRFGRLRLNYEANPSHQGIGSFP